MGNPIATEELTHTALNWQTASQTEIAAFKTWFVQETNCPYEEKDIQICCKKTGWTGEVLCDLYVKLPRDLKAHFLLLRPNGSEGKLSVLGGRCPEEGTGCQFCDS